MGTPLASAIGSALSQIVGVAVVEGHDHPGPPRREG